MKSAIHGLVCGLLFPLLVGTVAIGADGLPKSSAIAPGSLGARVDPFIGTGGISYLCANLFPGATTPFGLVRLNPDTISAVGRKATNMSGYYYHDDRIMGFSHTRLSGTGAIDGGHFLVMPSLSPYSALHRTLGLNAKYAHENETAFPGYYAVKLSESNIIAEMTATTRVGLHRYTFPQGSTPHVLVNVSSVLGSKAKAKDGKVRILPASQEIEGEIHTFGTFAARYGGIKVYFVGRLNRAFGEFGTWNGGKVAKQSLETEGDEVGVDLGFPTGDKPSTIELRLAISHVSVANARENLNAETDKLSFDEVFAKARDAWEEHLGRIQVDGGTEREREIFYTALYHSFIMPTSFNDVNGEYIGFDKKTHKAEGFTYYTDMSLWDTFRTTHPLYTLIAPREQRDMVCSLVEMAKQGGYLPRWPSGNGYTNSMFGTPADNVVAETYLKGIRDFDVETAYAAMRKTALLPPINSAFSGRRGIEGYLEYKYCPAESMEQAVSRTIEFSQSDAAVSKLAAALGKNKDAKLFEEHSRYYRNLWNPQTQYFQPRNSDGQFVKAFQPLLLTYLDRTGEFTNDYVEGSALQWRYAVPFDADGLVSLFKSREYFVEELNEFFEKSTPAVGAVPNAYYWQGNQPDLGAAYLFNAAGRPDLTQKWVRWILDKKHGDKENGLDGNDDGGTLSAWYVFSSLGLYPVAGSDRYEIGTSIWNRAELTTGDKKLIIIADNVAPDRFTIKRATLDDKPLDRWHVTHVEISNGATLRFEMK